MRVDRPGAINRVMIMVRMVSVAAVHVSVAVDVEVAAALVAGTRSRPLMKRNRHGHRDRADAFFLLDDRRREGRRAVIGAGGVVVVDAVGAGVAVPVPVSGVGVVGRGVVGAAFGSVLGRLVGGGHGSVEGGELAHHAFVLVLLVGVDGLGVLSQVVEPGELLAAVTGEGPFAGVFTVNGAKKIGKNMEDDDDAGDDDDEQTIMYDRWMETNRMCLARCSDLLKTMRQSVRRQAGDQERCTRVDRTGTKRLTAVASALESFRWRGSVALVDAVEAIVGCVCLRRGRRGR